MHHSVFHATLDDKLPSLFRTISDEGLISGARFVHRFAAAWEILPGDIQSKMEEYTLHLPGEHFDDIDMLY